MRGDDDHEFMHNVDDAVGGDLVRQSVGRGVGVEQVDDGVFFVRVEFVNMVVFDTADGLLLVDSGSRDRAERAHRAVRAVTSSPLHTVVLSHGHQDHAFGLGPWLEEAGARPPRIIAHANVPERYQRYAKTRGYNEHLNRVQFGVTTATRSPVADADFFWPNTLYEDRLTIRLGGEVFHLRHGKGHTNDATYVWVPGRRIICAGDFWEGMMPDCGSPQRTQRFAEGWATAAEEMAALEAELLLPGHGEPIHGAEAVAGCLLDIAEFLRSIVAQTLEALNRGLTHEEIVASVRIPSHLADRPYLQPVYDRPEFISRNIVRMYGGWWDGHPANLMPAPAGDRARAVVTLAGGIDALVAHAREVASYDLPLACHLAEWAMLAEPGSITANECARDIFGMRQAVESSLHVRAICGYAIRQAETALRAAAPQ
jgi:alkyl sulfatase BDS1-like metallo-beta-lactamase superfamily hydrolase